MTNSVLFFDEIQVPSPKNEQYYSFANALLA